MPINDFKCNMCQHVLQDVLHKHNEEPKECPSCGKLSLTRMISGASFKLGNSGYYVTDFKHK